METLWICRTATGWFNVYKSLDRQTIARTTGITGKIEKVAVFSLIDISVNDNQRLPNPPSYPSPRLVMPGETKNEVLCDIELPSVRVLATAA